MADLRGSDVSFACYSEGNAYDPERERVRELRMNDMECKTIAEVMGIPEGVVISHCIRLGLPISGTCRLVKLSPEEENWLRYRQGPPPDLKCPTCGKLIVQPQRGRKKRFCSEQCRFKHWNTKREEKRAETGRETVCENCGKTFFAVKEKEAERRFCCRECYFDYRYGRRGEWI